MLELTLDSRQAFLDHLKMSSGSRMYYRINPRGLLLSFLYAGAGPAMVVVYEDDDETQTLLEETRKIVRFVVEGRLEAV